MTRVGYLREHPLCCCCEANGEVAAAEVVDHIQPHRGDEVLFWKRDNWQPLCARCHNGIKKVLEARWEQGRIGADELRLDRLLPEFFAPPQGGCEV